jgi:hypothetical protein
MPTQKDTQSQIARKVKFCDPAPPRNRGVAGNVASISSIDVQREALSLKVRVFSCLKRE